MLAIAAFGGVLRRAMRRLLGVGHWTASIPISTGTTATRVTVFLFVASGIKNGTIWLSSFSEEGPGSVRWQFFLTFQLFAQRFFLVIIGLIILKERKGAVLMRGSFEKYGCLYN